MNVESPKQDMPVPTALGFSLYMDESDPLGLRATHEVYEANEIAACRRLIRAGDRVLDIGANIGYYTVLLSQLAGETGRIIAVEPDPANFVLLERNLALNHCRNVTTHQLALSDHASTATLYHCEFNTGMHRLYPSVCCVEDGIGVTSVPGDELVQDGLDFIKIDIEGYELPALKGLRGTLHAHHARLAVLTEFSPLALLEAGYHPAEFIDFVAALKLRPHAWDGQDYRPCDLATLKREISVFTRENFASYLAGCAHVTREQLWDNTVAYLAAIGYTRSYFENLLLLGANRTLA